MKLQVVRTQFGSNATNGLLFIDGVFECYTLEDEQRDVKVMHETCIPEGTYKIKLRNAGGFNTRYAKKYPTMHRGMLHIQDVPGFSWILIHQGNFENNTSGCLLLGNSQQDLDVSDKGFIGASADAYKKAYPKISNAILKGEEVTIEYTTINKLFTKPLDQASSIDVDIAKDIMEKLQEVNGNVIKTNAMLKGRVIR
jgi:hypothetical protein|tara:strand:+ start:16372 stop:16962 length:591 start_codon:yes stop_codon:yes gene_type:complete